jgi:hypothetical protein
MTMGVVVSIELFWSNMANPAMSAPVLRMNVNAGVTTPKNITTGSVAGPIFGLQ